MVRLVAGVGKRCQCRPRIYPLSAPQCCCVPMKGMPDPVRRETRVYLLLESRGRGYSGAMKEGKLNSVMMNPKKV